MSWHLKFGKAPREEKKKTPLASIITLVMLAVLMMFGIFVIKGKYYENPTIVPEPTFEEQMEITEEYIRLLDDVNAARQELIDLYKLRILEAEGKLHSS